MTTLLHPLDQFTHCPKCGGEFTINCVKSKRCESCGFVYYFNPSAAVVAIIKNSNGEILVTTRGREPALGSLDLPGGFVDSFESGEESVRREVMEECNIEVEEVKYLFSIPNIYTYCGFEVHTLDLFFECRVDNFETLRADDDVAELRFIDKEKIVISQFGLRSIQEGLREYISRR